MHSVGYAIPQGARPIFERLIERLRQLRGRRPRVLDIGSSYGVNASLLRYELGLDELYRHYTDHAHLKNDPVALRVADRAFLGSLRERVDAYFIGIDSSAPAISYAVDVGLLDDGFVMDLDHDLEHGTGTPDLDVDLIISTGTVGYIGPGAFARILGMCTDTAKLWIATFALRLVDFDPYTKILLDCGLTTETYPDAFVQRNIVDTAELVGTMDHARRRGLALDGLEGTGRLFANLYLSCANDSDGGSLTALLTGHEHAPLGH
jgi:carnitine O-acetyltransferase